MPMYDYSMLLQSDTANTTEAVTTNEVNFGVTTPAPNMAGNFGLHVIVTTVYTTLTSGVIFWIINGSTATLTTSSTKHTGMFIAAAKMVAGAHFFIPAGSIPLLQYAGAMFSPVSEAAGSGKCTMYFGAPEDGAK